MHQYKRNRQYFVLMEQSVLCEVNSLLQALFVAFSCCYVYNLEYPLKASSIFFFFQDYLVGYPDSVKRSSSYITVLLTLRNICVSTISGTPSSLNFHLIHHIILSSHHIHPIHAYFHGFVVLWQLFYPVLRVNQLIYIVLSKYG